MNKKLKDPAFKLLDLLVEPLIKRTPEKGTFNVGSLFFVDKKSDHVLIQYFNETHSLYFYPGIITKFTKYFPTEEKDMERLFKQWFEDRYKHKVKYMYLRNFD